MSYLDLTRRLAGDPEQLELTWQQAAVTGQAQAFSEAGFDVVNLTGGIVQWIEDGQPIEPADGYVAEPGEAAAILEAKARAAGN